MSKKNQHEIVIKISDKEWEIALDKAFIKKAKDIKVDGFRKGKIPRDIYDKKFGKESLYMDAIDIVLPNAYTKALNENNIIPVVQPQVDIKSISDAGVEIKFSIITKPEVKLGQYKDLKVEKPKIDITKEEIELEIDKLKKQYSEMIIKEGKVDNGDIAVIDFEGFKDGQPFEGGKGENYPLEIGSKVFIPGFEEQLVGMNKDESKEIEITFPKDYPADELKDKKVTFKVTVKDIKTRSIPELNEDFFKDLDMAGVNDKKSLEKELKDRLKTTKEFENDNVYVDMILEACAKNVEVDIPEEMINDEVDRMLGRFKEQLKMQGIDIEQYYQITRMSEEDLRTKMHEEAQKHVLYRLMLEAIAQQEKIEITDKEANKEAESLAEKYQMPKEEFLKLFGGLDMIKYDLQMRKTLELLKNNN